MLSYRYLPHALFAAIVLVPLAVAAQTAERDPSNAQAAASSAAYQSAFTDYKNDQDTQMVPWRTANDEVGQTGGMAGHNMGDMKGMSGQGKMGNMPGHDMSNMKGADNAEKMKSMPSHDMKGMDGMTGMKGKETATGMSGHDMGNMQEKSAPRPATKPAPSSGKPAERASQTMPGHNGMQKQ